MTEKEGYASVKDITLLNHNHIGQKHRRGKYHKKRDHSLNYLAPNDAKLLSTLQYTLFKFDI